jgi:hypothetical protein
MPFGGTVEAASYRTPVRRTMATLASASTMAWAHIVTPAALAYTPEELVE